MTVSYEHDVARAAFGVVSAVFTSLGRYLLCLDENFRVVHASPTMRELLNGDAFGPLEGRPVADLLGKDLFGTDAAMRDALLAGERREGWRALLQTTQGIRPLAITAAPRGWRIWSMKSASPWASAVVRAVLSPYET